jgi:hypothetical protein
MRSKSIVIEDEMLEGHMGREESDERGLCVQAESVIVKVDSVKIW